ncbi:MAG: S1/P1 nuclease [Alphaproteobacteria bacterium]
MLPRPRTGFLTVISRPRSGLPTAFVILLVPLLAFAGPRDAAAWGCAGHVIVATGALDLASPATRTAIADLLDGGSLQAASCWLDDIRSSRPDTKRWHYVDIPGGATSYDPARDCAPTPEGDCLVAAIGRARTALADPARPRAERAEALRVLSHLVGDLHQPLHCDDHDDHGGNAVGIEFLGDRTNLHQLWDSGFVEQELRESWNWPGFPESVYALLDGERGAARGEVVDWAMETHALGESAVYARLPDDRRLGLDALRRDEPVLRRQLARASVRLAALLDATLGQPPVGASRP